MQVDIGQLDIGFYFDPVFSVIRSYTPQLLFLLICDAHPILEF